MVGQGIWHIAPCLEWAPRGGHCHHGQSRQSQSDGLAPRDQSGRRQALVPAALFTRPQSDRADLRQNQALAAPRSEAFHRGHMAICRRPRLNHPTCRMHQLLRQRRIRFRQSMNRSGLLVSGATPFQQAVDRAGGYDRLTGRFPVGSHGNLRVHTQASRQYRADFRPPRSPPWRGSAPRLL